MTPRPDSIVLVVEDDAESRESLKELLELEGWAVVTAENGREALDKLQAISPCVVLLDLFMPVMDGWKVVDQLRSDGRLGRLKIIVITSAGHTAPAGFPVFQKPLDLEKLSLAVSAACP